MKNIMTIFFLTLYLGTYAQDLHFPRDLISQQPTQYNDIIYVETDERGVYYISTQQAGQIVATSFENVQDYIAIVSFVNPVKNIDPRCLGVCRANYMINSYTQAIVNVYFKE